MRRLIWIVTVACLSTTGSAIAESRRNEPPTLMIQIINTVGVPDTTLTAALEHTRRIFAIAGIGTVFTGEDAPADDVVGCRMRLTISLVDRAFASRLDPDDDALGLAPGDGTQDARWAYVFYDRVGDYVAKFRKDTSMPGHTLAALLLGQVVAHESGHLLLPHRQHAVSGIMRARIGKDTIKLISAGGVWFARKEKGQMRQTINERADCPNDLLAADVR